ncbi:MAG TPA: aldehyde dehydrogenase family protein [Pseudonocardiaceae bacterium]
MLTDTRLSPATLALLADLDDLRSEGWVRAGGEHELEVVDPSAGDVVGRVPASSPGDVTEAVAGARTAFDGGPWSGLPAKERGRALQRLTAELDTHREAFAEIGVLEVGTPISLSRGLHGSAPVAFFEWFADAAVRGPMGGYQEGLPLSEQPVLAASTIFREPIGVVAAITAYNFPLLITAFKVGGALAAGCTAVLMPSPRTVLSAIAFARCARAAELPPGSVTVVLGEAAVGEALTTADGVDMVTFTGSVGVGRKVMEQAARGLKKVVLELGGKSPNVLLPGAEVATAVGPSILRYTRNAGQGCGATTRTLVPRAQYADYAAAAKEFVDGLTVGDPWDPATDLGPLIRGEHRDRVEGYVRRALDAGGVIEAGGGRPPADRGYFMNPALVGGVAPGAEICQEELFGPVGVLLPYDSVEQALEIANGTRYGLNANVWGPTDEAMRFARRLKAGTVTLNGGGADRPDAPWPGLGDSGVGVDRGMEGFREFFTLRHVQYPLAAVGR